MRTGHATITWREIPTPDFDPTLDLRSVIAPIMSVLALILRSSVEIGCKKLLKSSVVICTLHLIYDQC